MRPDTVIRWHRAGFRVFWKWKSRPRRGGRRPIHGELIGLIRQMNRAKPLWGAPRIHAIWLSEILGDRCEFRNRVHRHSNPSGQANPTSGRGTLP